MHVTNKNWTGAFVTLITCLFVVRSGQVSGFVGQNSPKSTDLSTSFPVPLPKSPRSAPDMWIVELFPLATDDAGGWWCPERSFLPSPRRANRVHARLAVLYCDVFACCSLSLPFLPKQEQTRGTLNIEPWFIPHPDGRIGPHSDGILVSWELLTEPPPRHVPSSQNLSWLRLPSLFLVNPVLCCTHERPSITLIVADVTRERRC